MCRRFRLTLDRLPESEVYPGIVLPRSYETTPGKSAYGLAYTVKGNLKPFLFTFGYPGLDEKLLYNARMETVTEKKTFQEDYVKHKAVFPATSFFEFDVHHEEHEFVRSDHALLYLAGFYSREMRFVLLTEKGEGESSFLPPRMPVVLLLEDVVSYLHGEEITSRKRPLLLEENPSSYPLF